MNGYRKRAKILQAMAHPVRLQILEILARGPARVCDLIRQTRQRQACVSQHLMLLRQTGLVRSMRLGWNMQYELARPDITAKMLRCALQPPRAKIKDQGEIR
jgi:ArsR family transcriptional regulator